MAREAFGVAKSKKADVILTSALSPIKWCEKRESNPYVRSTHASETCLSANSNTLAQRSFFLSGDSFPECLYIITFFVRFVNTNFKNF